MILDPNFERIIALNKQPRKMRYGKLVQNSGRLSITSTLSGKSIAAEEGGAMTDIQQRKKEVGGGATGTIAENQDCLLLQFFQRRTTKFFEHLMNLSLSGDNLIKPWHYDVLGLDAEFDVDFLRDIVQLYELNLVVQPAKSFLSESSNGSAKPRTLRTCGLASCLSAVEPEIMILEPEPIGCLVDKPDDK